MSGLTDIVILAQKWRNTLTTIQQLIGNVDHSKGHEAESAKGRGELLNDIRSIINSTLGENNHE